MKDLLLMRHAKAVAGAPDKGDHERALNGRGRRAAAAVARELRRLRARPDVILCSPARRTRETLAELLAVYAPPPPTLLEPELYLAEAGQLLARFRRLEPDVGCALLVGHNEGLAQIAIALAGSGAPSVLTSMQSKFPTGAVAWLRFAIDDWAEVAPAGGELVAFVRPRDLGGGA